MAENCSYTFTTAGGEVTIKGMAAMKAFLVENGVEAIQGSEVLDRAMFSNRVFHGTPARGITKFSTDFVGAGEGAQAYGWGLYFASKRDIAEFYREKLTGGDLFAPFEKDGRVIDTGVDLAEAYYRPGKIVRGYGGADKVLEFRRTDNGGWAVKVVGVRANGEPMSSERPRWHSTFPSRTDLKLDLEADGWKAKTPGQLYEVDIPEDSEMLLWDRPLSEQPEKVRGALLRAIDRDPEDGEPAAWKNYTGNAFYRELSDREGSDQQASEWLANAGIKGIKYLDGGSRADGDGSYNYVVFSGDDVEVQQAYYSNRAQTDTPAFKRWFGDSKVVDADGRPLVVYHGTTADVDFYEFWTYPDYGLGAHFGTVEQANSFANQDDAIDDVEEPGARVKPVYLSIRNPIRLIDPGTGGWNSDAVGQQLVSAGILDEEVVEASDQMDSDEYARAMRSALEKAGYDGIVYLNRREGDIDSDRAAEFNHLSDKAFKRKFPGASDSYIAFDPTQIKSAIGNSGAFDPENPDIRFSNRSKESWFLGRDELGRFKLGAGAKAYRYAADMANIVLDKLSLKPIGKDLSRAMRQMRLEITKAQELTVDVATKMQELPAQEREMISDVIEGELKRGANPPKRVLEIAASMQGIMSEQTAELVRLGMLTPEAAGRWDGKYLPRFYESKLGSELSAWAKATKALLGRKRVMQGIGGSSLKGRGIFKTIPVEELESWLAEGWEERDPKFNPDTDTEITVWRDYTRSERDDMGEIRDSMFRFVMGYNKSQRDIALGRLYENLANTVASKSEKEGYVQVPATNIEDTYAKRYGKLAGKWVPKEVLDHLSSFDESMQNEILKMYLKGMSLWKEGKTVLNPVSHANNVLSNVTMAHFAGVSYWDAHKYVGAVRDLVKNDPMVQEAKDAGLFMGTMTQAEMVQLLPDQLKVLAAKTESKAGQAVEGVWNALSFWLRKPFGKAYEAEDLFFRYLIYRDARERGLDPADATDYAQKYIFTYDDLPKTARAIRNFALPFFAYTYKVVPTMAQTALEHPWRYAAPAAALYTINAAMYAMAASLGGGEDEDWWTIIKRYVTDPEFRQRAKELEANERTNLPEWMKGASMTLGTQKAIRLGVDELTGLPVFLDVSRIFPGGDLFDAHNNAGGVPLLSPITPNNPILTTAYAMLANKDTFRGKDVVKPSDTDAEAAAKRAEWAWRQFTPAIAVGNGHFERAMNVIANQTGQPVNLGIVEYTGVNRQGQPVQPGYAAMQTVGIKATPIDLELSQQIRDSEKRKLIREIEAEIRSLTRLENKGAISFEAAEAARERQREKRQRLREGLTVDGEERR